MADMRILVNYLTPSMGLGGSRFLLLVGLNAFCNFVCTTLLFVFFTSIYR